MPSPRGACSRRYGAVIFLVALGHLIVGAGLLQAPAAPPSSPPAAGPILLTLAPPPAVSAPPAASKSNVSRPSAPPPADAPVAPAPPPPEAEPETPPGPAPASTPSTPGWILDAAAPCDVLGGVQRRLQDDASVMDALRTLPANARSVANAIMLWDGTWRQDGPPRPLAVLRSALERALAGAPEACLATSNAGPRLIMLQDGRGTTLLAIGSGVWTWSQLAAPWATAAAVK